MCFRYYLVIAMSILLHSGICGSWYCPVNICRVLRTVGHDFKCYFGKVWEICSAIIRQKSGNSGLKYFCSAAAITTDVFKVVFNIAVTRVEKSRFVEPKYTMCPINKIQRVIVRERSKMKTDNCSHSHSLLSP